jgi:hypothetical protein
VSEASQQRAEEAIRHAEQVLDDWARQALYFTVRTLSRAREEAQDVWAEARAASAAETMHNAGAAPAAASSRERKAVTLTEHGIAPVNSGSGTGG